MRLLSWRDGEKGPEHLVRFGKYRPRLLPSPLYEEVWLTRAGMRSHNISRDVLDKAKKKEETGEGRVKRESPKKEEDEGIEVDEADHTQGEVPQGDEDEAKAEDAKDDEHDEGTAESGDNAEDARDAARNHSNEG